MIAAPSILERVVHNTPLGVRFVDVATGRHVGDELSVIVTPEAGGRGTVARRTPSGVYFARGLPGLRSVEFAEASPETTPEAKRFRVSVRDLAGRFHDVSFVIGLPHRGLVTLLCGSPPASPPVGVGFVPLFSLPSRPVPAGMAVVRARLRLDDGSPAAWAALEVTPAPGARAVRAIADRRGEVAALFPYPEPIGLTGSPPSAARTSLTQASWDVALRAFLPDPGSSLDPAPDVCTFLDQSPATLLTRASPPMELTEDTLEYGRELVLRSSLDDPELLVRP